MKTILTLLILTGNVYAQEIDKDCDRKTNRAQVHLYQCYEAAHKNNKQWSELVEMCWKQFDKDKRCDPNEPYHKVKEK